MARTKLTGEQFSTHQVNLQAITTNSVADVKIQTGWSYIQGAGTNTQSKTITFPVAFTTILNVLVTPLGITTGGVAPTSLGSFNAGYSGNIADMTAFNISTTSMTVTATLDSSAVLVTSVYAGFSWIAIGT